MPSYEVDLAKFEAYNTQVLGISIDHVPCLKAWAESLDGISYPLLSDFWPHGEVAQRYGVLRDDGVAERALFVVDKEGVVRYVDIHDFDEQPDNEEVFRVLRELEPDAVMPEEEERRVPRPVAAADRPRSVVLYCRPGCIDCRLARRFLDRNGIPYTDINVRATPGAEARVRQWTGGPLISPVFDIDGSIVIDFKRAELREALGLK
jgi:glutaredoxin